MKNLNYREKLTTKINKTWKIQFKNNFFSSISVETVKLLKNLIFSIQTDNLMEDKKYNEK